MAVVVSWTNTMRKPKRLVLIMATVVLVDLTSVILVMLLESMVLTGKLLGYTLARTVEVIIATIVTQLLMTTVQTVTLLNVRKTKPPLTPFGVFFLATLI